MSYRIPICAVSGRADRYVWTCEGTEDEVVAQMADEQECSEDDIRDEHEIEESYVEVPDNIREQIIEDYLKEQSL